MSKRLAISLLCNLKMIKISHFLMNLSQIKDPDLFSW